MNPILLSGQVLLGAIRQGAGPHFRAFFAVGSDLAEFAPPAAGREDAPTPYSGNISEVRGVSGGIMLAGHDRAASPQIQLAHGSITLDPIADEHSLFAGLNVILAFRLHESANVVADWLAYHAQHHGLQAALIFDRAAPRSTKDKTAGFTDMLGAAMSVRGLSHLRVVVLNPGIPLGKAGSPAENHIWTAPDAPNKDRMIPPPDDPWRAPLGEELILELAKWWFLADARAVLLLDVTDLVAPMAAAKVSVFDLCVQAPKGVIALHGKNIYPWRLRDDHAPQFGDHICSQFEVKPPILRWGVAPAVAGFEKTWRMARVSYSKPQADQSVAFWRAMAIRIDGQGNPALAAKASLTEDPELLRASTALFGYKPVRMPVAAIKSGPSNRTCIVTTMKNEGPFILEWLAYHRAIGVEDVLVYTNDCTDGTDTLLSMLQDKGLLQHRANPWKPDGTTKPQHAALQAAEAEAIVQNAGWVICMDVDEFINVKLGDGKLATLFAAMEAALPGANMISMTWRLFGNSDVHHYTDTFLTQQFALCAQEVVRKPHQAWGFKTLFRNLDIYKKIGVHRPKGLAPSLHDKVKWLNGSGRAMPDKMLRNGWRSSLDTYGYDWVQLNHYAVRSVESFLVKRDRGRVNHTERDQGLAYWFRMNHNAVEDRSIQARHALLQAEWDRLMRDPDIRAAHDHSVARHRAKIAELRATPAHGDFYDELKGMRMQTLSRRLKHFGTAVFAAGPSVVPDEIALAPDLPPDFFFTIKAPEDHAQDHDDADARDQAET